MEESVQNKSEGILGAIKAVTNKPSVNAVDNRSKEKVPKPKSISATAVRSKSTSTIIQEIERSRSVAKTSVENKNQSETQKTLPPFAKRDNIESKLSEKAELEKTKEIGSASVPPDSAPGAKDNMGQSTAPEVLKDLRKRPKSEQGARAGEQRDTLSSRTPKKLKPETVLPAGRPASVNLEVDQVLDSLNLGAKSDVYLIEKIRSQVSNNLLNAEEGDICKPDMAIAGPVFDALSYVCHQAQIVSLYANLISTAMTSKTARFAHPGFVDLIRNITEDEARVLSWFHNNKVLPVIDIKKVLTKRQSEMRLNTLVSCIAQEAGCQFDDLAESYLANLERVGLLEIPRTTCLTDDSLYQNVMTMPAVEERLSSLNGGSSEFRGEVVKYYAKLSVYGIRFCHACIR